MTAFIITVTGPDSYIATRRFPSVWCANAALEWATMLRDGYTADVTEAEAAAAEARRLRMEQEQQAKERKQQVENEQATKKRK